MGGGYIKYIYMDTRDQFSSFSMSTRRKDVEIIPNFIFKFSDRDEHFYFETFRAKNLILTVNNPVRSFCLKNYYWYLYPQFPIQISLKPAHPHPYLRYVPSIYFIWNISRYGRSTTGLITETTVRNLYNLFS